MQNECNKKLPSAVSPSLPICSYDPFWVKNNIGVGIHNYDHSLQLHYRLHLVALLFADLSSLCSFIS